MSDFVKETKFLLFLKMDEQYIVMNKNKEDLGTIEFNKKWEKWCFFPDRDTFYDATCLKDIYLFIECNIGNKNE